MTDIAELFRRDPLELKKDPEALKQVVEHFRANRRQFTLAAQKGPEAKPRTTQAAKAIAGLDLGLKLDLGAKLK